MSSDATSRPLELPPMEAMDALPLEALPAVLAELAALQGRAAARLCQSATSGRRDGEHPTRLLTAAEVAARTNLSRDYVYRHASRFPFARRFGRAVRFDEAGLERWLAARRPG